jgi:hypothetical protein
MKPDTLYELVRKYVKFMWPFSRQIHKLPYGKNINWALLVADYRSTWSIKSDEELRQWAILDTFDMLSPHYDQPQTKATLRRWFANNNLKNVDIQYGYNGIEARGVKP